jgi:hypothetical protein
MHDKRLGFPDWLGFLLPGNVVSSQAVDARKCVQERCAGC